MALLRPAYLIGGLMGVAAAAYGFFVWREKQNEVPDYQLVEAEGDIEIRDYPELLVAEAAAAGERTAALNAGFRKLARYIFAEDREGEGIPMTAPVLSEPGGPGWRTRFVIPAELSREELPPPGPGVEIVAVPPRRVAAIRFSGRATDQRLRAKEAELKAWLERKGKAAGAVSYAFYNSPYVAPALRRNEVMIELP
jgi:effector-binding domain-containing protein